jgi:hypothetical protein
MDQSPPPPPPPSVISEEYQRVLDESSRENLVDLENMMSITTGTDKDGNKVILLIPSVVFTHTKDYDTQLRRMLLLFVKMAHSIVQESYTLVYAHTHLPVFSQQKIAFQIHKMLPREYKKNLARLIVVHPTFLIKAFFETVRWFISEKFYRKLSFVTSIAELQVIIPPSQIPLPAQFLATEDAQKGLTRPPFMTPLNLSFDPALGTTPLIHKCTEYIRQTGEGFRTSGIFRLAGDQIQEDLVKTRLYGQPPDKVEAYIKIGLCDDGVSLADVGSGTVAAPQMSTVVLTDIHTVSSVLKISLRDLEEPLFTFDIYDRLMVLAKKYEREPDQCECEEYDSAVEQLLKSMPDCNYRTLQHLLKYVLFNV